MYIHNNKYYFVQFILYDIIIMYIIDRTVCTIVNIIIHNVAYIRQIVL